MAKESPTIGKFRAPYSVYFRMAGNLRNRWIPPYGMLPPSRYNRLVAATVPLDLTIWQF